MQKRTAPACAEHRFVPASPLDFSRYAKNLAWLVGIKLQEAQELLSRVYGYEHLHELQQALSKGLPAGPYWDEGPPDGETPIEELSLLCGLPGERSLRPLKIFLDWKAKRGGHRWLENNESFIPELGLTDSPPSHRDCVRRVKALLDGEYTVDPHGYPTGFWSFLSRYRLDRLGTAFTNLKQTVEIDEWWGTGGPIDPADQRLCIARSRAVDVVWALGEAIEHEDVEWGFNFGEIEQDWLSMWELLGDDNPWVDPWEEACVEYVFNWEDNEYPDDQVEAMLEFVRWPCARRLSKCGLDLDLSETCSKVGKWRLGWLRAAAAQWIDEKTRIIALEGESHHQEDGHWVRDPGTVTVVMRRLAKFDSDEISLLDVTATMTVADEQGKDVVVALAKGWHFAPLGDRYFSDFETVDAFIDDYDLLPEGWRLMKRYMSIRGIERMKDWVNSDEGCGMTLVKLTMAEPFDSDQHRARMIVLLTNCFDEEGGPYTSSSEQFGFQNHFASMEDMYMETDSLTICSPGLLIASIEGIKGVGMSVASEDGESRQLLVTGVGAGTLNRRRRLSWHADRRKSEEEKESKPRVRRLLEAIGDAKVDVAILDLESSDDAPNDQDTD